MIEISVHKAQGLRGDDPQSVMIRIDETIPVVPTLEAARNMYLNDAQTVMRGLAQLPHGTRYQLLLLMLRDAEIMYRGR